jgi:hypothetical protein
MNTNFNFQISSFGSLKFQMVNTNFNFSFQISLLGSLKFQMVNTNFNFQISSLGSLKFQMMTTNFKKLFPRQIFAVQITLAVSALHYNHQDLVSLGVQQTLISL